MNFSKFYGLFLCALCTSCQIVFFNSTQLGHNISLMAGINSSLLCIDGNRTIHQYKIFEQKISYLSKKRIGFKVQKLSSIYLKNKSSKNDLYFLKGSQNIIVSEIKDNIQQEKIIINSDDKIIAAAPGQNLNSVYLISKSAQSEIYQLLSNVNGSNQTLQIMNFTEKPSVIFTNEDQNLIGMRNGKVYSTYSSEYLNFSHKSKISSIFYHNTEKILVTGSSSGQIIISSGNMIEGYNFKVSFHKHQCEIILTMLINKTILSSDSCGYISQYDIEKKLLLDYILHPHFSGNQKVFITHLLDGNFIATMKKGSSILYSFRVNRVQSQIKSYRKQIIKIFGNILSFPCLRLVFKISMPVLVLFQDLHYYSYHKYNYNKMLKIFLKDLHLINNHRIYPTLFGSQYISKNFTFHTTILKNTYPVHDSANKKIFNFHFLQYTRSIYTEAFLQSFTIFVVIKLIYNFLLKILKNKTKAIIFLSLFEGNTLFWFFMIVLLGDNMVYLSFACGAQLRLVFAEVFSHKLNLLAAIVCWFFLLIYSICYNTLTWKFFRKRIASNALYLCRPTLKGFVLEMFLFGIRNMLSGFVHGFLLDHHLLQICLLVGINLIILVLIIFLRKQFYYSYTFFFTLSYYLCFQIFNIVILVEVNKHQQFSTQFEKLQLNIIIVLVLISYIRFLGSIISFFRELKYQNDKVNQFIAYISNQRKIDEKKITPKSNKNKKGKNMNKKKKKKKVNKNHEQNKNIKFEEQSQVFKSQIPKGNKCHRNKVIPFNTRIHNVQFRKKQEIKAISNKISKESKRQNINQIENKRKFDELKLKEKNKKDLLVIVELENESDQNQKQQEQKDIKSQKGPQFEKPKDTKLTKTDKTRKNKKK